MHVGQKGETDDRQKRERLGEKIFPVGADVAGNACFGRIDALLRISRLRSGGGSLAQQGDYDRLAVLWVLWLVFKNLIKFLLLAAVAAAVFFGYYRYENRNEIACREQGGVWDGEKGVCGDKTGWTEKLEELMETVCRRERG